MLFWPFVFSKCMAIYKLKGYTIKGVRCFFLRDCNQIYIHWVSSYEILGHQLHYVNSRISGYIFGSIRKKLSFLDTRTPVTDLC